jgi:hypothetical protein
MDIRHVIGLPPPRVRVWVVGLTILGVVIGLVTAWWVIGF